MDKNQSLDNKIGEIDFRKKLASQQIKGEKFLDDEFSCKEIEKTLQERMEKTKEQMQILKNRGIVLSPYLELGAERGQRALVMENDLNFKGAAIDISYDMLLACDNYAKKFNKSKVPLRICCDAYNLPYLSNSLPFAFCYETLHHFPDPTPIIKEIYRVLAPGGSFFFAEEPCKGFLQFKFFKNKNKIYSVKSLKRSFLRRAIEHFFYKPLCNEIEHGIIENDKISIFLWKRALSIFATKNVELEAANSILKTEMFNPKSFFKFVLFCLIGGGVKGLCRKDGELPQVNQNYDILRCPSCASVGREEKLQSKENFYHCSACNQEFPIKNGVLFLFIREELEKLYPQYSK